MNSKTNLKILLATMQPILHEWPYVFCVVSQDIYDKLSFDPLCTFHEQEGTTVITTQQQASDNGLLFDAIWACITRRIHSSLSAVGFLADINRWLARAGISVNSVFAYHHDYLFFPWESRKTVLNILKELSRSE